MIRLTFAAAPSVEDLRGEIQRLLGAVPPKVEQVLSTLSTACWLNPGASQRAISDSALRLRRVLQIEFRDPPALSPEDRVWIQIAPYFLLEQLYAAGVLQRGQRSTDHAGAVVSQLPSTARFDNMVTRYPAGTDYEYLVLELKLPDDFLVLCIKQILETETSAPSYTLANGYVEIPSKAPQGFSEAA